MTFIWQSLFVFVLLRNFLNMKVKIIGFIISVNIFWSCEKVKPVGSIPISLTHSELMNILSYDTLQNIKILTSKGFFSVGKDKNLHFAKNKIENCDCCTEGVFFGSDDFVTYYVLGDKMKHGYFKLLDSIKNYNSPLYIETQERIIKKPKDVNMRPISAISSSTSMERECNSMVAYKIGLKIN